MLALQRFWNCLNASVAHASMKKPRKNIHKKPTLSYARTFCTYHLNTLLPPPATAYVLPW